MQFWTVDELERHAMADHEVGEEISPGVTITRRRILQLGLAALAVGVTGCAAPGRRTIESQSASSAHLTIEQLLASLRPQAKQLIASDRPDESAYLTAVTKLLSRYEPEEPWSMRTPEEGRFSMSPAAMMPPVVVFEIHMQPGSKIDLHDHRHYNGVLMCMEGAMRCRNFDIVQPDGHPIDVAAGEVPPKGEDFLIRQNHDSTIQPGQFSTLSRDRDNIHEVVAGPDGCRVTDVFTYFRREARSYSLAWDGKPMSNGGDLYKVSWKS